MSNFQDAIGSIIEAETTPTYTPAPVSEDGYVFIWDETNSYEYNVSTNEEGEIVIDVWDEQIGMFWGPTYTSAQDAIDAVNADRNDYNGAPSEQWEVTTPDEVYASPNI